MVSKLNDVKQFSKEQELPVKALEKKMEVDEKAKKIDSTVASKINDKGYVYEPAKKVEKAKEPYKVNKMSEKERAALVEQMKKDTEARKTQLINLVQQTLTGQGKALSLATNNKDDIWKVLAKGDFKVDEAAKKQAEEDISEKGYWGVEETSKRLFDFASALAGDDVEKMKEMKDALLKGYKEATKAWGKELPEISKKTLDAANKLFDQYFEARKTEEKAAMSSQAASNLVAQAGTATSAKAPLPDGANLGVKSVMM